MNVNETFTVPTVRYKVPSDLRDAAFEIRNALNRINENNPHAELKRKNADRLANKLMSAFCMIYEDAMLPPEVREIASQLVFKPGADHD